MDKTQVEISTGIIFRTILIVLGIWFLYVIRGIIALLFIAVIFSSAIEPLVNWINKRKIPRSFSVLIIYLLLFFIIGSLFSLLTPQVLEQSKEFSQNLPRHIENISRTFGGIKNFFQVYGGFINVQDFLDDIGRTITDSSGEIFSTTISFFQGLISVVVVLSLTFYLSVKKDGMKIFITSIMPSRHQEYAVSLSERMQIKIGRWMQGQFILMIIIFVLDFLVLYFLGVPYALVLALLGGVLEVIPYLGPIIAAIPAVLVGLLVSPLTGLLVFLFYVVIQQFENHVIVPQVMKRAVGLNPIAVILALLIGAKLGGVLGVILSVPFVTAASVFVQDVMEEK